MRRSKIISATWVNSQQKSVVQSLLQSAESEDDEDLSLQPQATAAAFSSQGSPWVCKIETMLRINSAIVCAVSQK